MIDIVAVRPRRSLNPWCWIQHWRADRRAREYVFRTGDPSRCIEGVEQFTPLGEHSVLGAIASYKDAPPSFTRPPLEHYVRVTIEFPRNRP